MRAGWAAILVIFLGGLPTIAADINIALAGGRLVIRNTHFINESSFFPELRFVAINETSSFWNYITLHFDIGGTCGSAPRRWSVKAGFALGWTKDYPVTKEYRDLIIPLVEKVDGCVAETIEAKLVSAENRQIRIDGASGRVSDLKAEMAADLAAVATKRDAELAARQRTEAEESAAARKAEREESALAQRKAASARASLRKREAVAANIIFTRLSKLPLVTSGTSFAFVASDRKCAEQFQQALAMEGLEKRKRVADLVAYGCGFLVDSPIHVELIRNDSAYALVRLAEGREDGRDGWVPIGWMR